MLRERDIEELESLDQGLSTDVPGRCVKSTDVYWSKRTKD